MESQWRELKTFLVDAWELFSWSLWCPSRLQERMNQIHGKDRTNGFDIFLLDSSKKKNFVKQYFFISLILTIPIIILVIHSSTLDWVILFSFVTLISPSGIGVWFLPTGVAWSAPLLFLLSAWVEPILLEQIFDEGKIKLLQLFSSSQNAVIGAVIGIAILFISPWIGFFIVKHRLYKNWQFPGNPFSTFTESIVIASVSIFFGSIVATANPITSSILTVLTAFFAYSLKEYLEINSSGLYTYIRDEEICSILYRVILVAFLSIASSLLCFSALVVTFFMAIESSDIVLLAIIAVVLSIFIGVIFIIKSAVKSSIATSLASVLSMIAAAVISLIIIAVSKLPLLFYLIACAILAFVFAGKNHNWVLILVVVMLMLGFENLQADVFWIIPVILLFYYRILPDYLLSIAFSLFYAIPVIPLNYPNYQRFSIQNNALSLAKNMPLLNSELVWLPIPKHDAILASAFQQSPTEALKIYQNLQRNPLPGAKITLYNALPGIVANCLQAAYNTDDLLQIETEDHPQLSLLIPEYYQSTTDGKIEDFTAIKRQHEIVIVFPLLQNLIQNTHTALNIGVIALRERELEQILTDTKLLASQLPSLGIPPKSVPRWQSVLTHWQRLLELELIEQRKQSQGELLSPFQYGNPLKPRDTFKGRRALADRLYRLVLDRNRPTLVLHGPRRFGKTSFLNNLPRLLPTDLIPIYLDLQSSALSSSEADFCYGLTRAIHKDTRSQNLNLPAVPARDSFKPNPYTTLEDWLDQSLPLLPPGRRLLLNLDEFEKIGTAITAGNLSLNLLNELRHLIQHRDELAFLFSGVQTLDELGPNWSSYFISVVPIEMLYLEPPEAEDLLRNPDPDFKMGYEDGLVETIIHLTHCQPYLLQLIGACLVDQANRAQVKTATHPLLELAIPEAFTAGEPYFTNLWTEFTGTTPAEVQAGQQILQAITQNHPISLTTPEAQSAHRRLQRFHILTANDRIEIPLFERWVKERSIDSIR
jgi:hypothetical protein